MFGERGRKAVNKEIKQLHNCQVWEPIKVEDLTPLEQKRDGTMKASVCANGSTQRSYANKDEASSPTAATEAILITGVIKAKQSRNIMTLDIQNMFVQMPIPEGDHKIVMKIRGMLVDVLIQLFPGVYEDYVVYEAKNKALYVHMLMALYGMMVSFINVNVMQHTVTWHVDNVKSSHVDATVNDAFEQWCEETYGSDQNGHIKVVQGKKHDYLGMILNYEEDGVLQVNMRYHISAMIDEFP
eukprot:5573548-Ditylum_brightwellii.AAC.2